MALEGTVGLHAGREVECPSMEHRPATMFALNAPKIHSDFGLSVGRDAVHVVLKQHVLGRDGSIRLQLENPMPVASLAPQQGAAGTAMLCRISGAESVAPCSSLCS